MLSISGARASFTTVTEPMGSMGDHSSLQSPFTYVLPSGYVVYSARFDAPLYREMTVTSFVSGGSRKQLLNPLIFLWTLNPETRLYEIKGDGPYQDILVYGDSMTQAIAILEQEILPCLWEDYANEDDERLSRRARQLKVDLLARVAPDACGD